MEFHYRMARAGSDDERVRATRFLGALLKEAHLAETGQLGYPSRPVDTVKISGMITENLTHPDFRVRAWSAFALRSLPLPPNSEQADRLAATLSDSHWFVRFMGIHALLPTADLQEYFDWSGKIEQNELVRRQIQLQQGIAWERIDMPINVPKTEEPAY